MLLGMGFTQIQVDKAVAEAGDNPEAAANFIMMNMDQPDEWWLAAPAPAPAPALAPDDAGEHAEVLKPFLEKFRVAGPQDQVHKEECVYSCTRTTSEKGLFVGLETFNGVGESMLSHHCARTQETCFLNIKRRRKAPPEGQTEEVQSVAEMVANSAKEAKVEYNETLTLVLIQPDGARAEIDLSGQPLLPGKAQLSIDSVINANDAGRQEDLGDWKNDITESIHADSLVQEPTDGKVISCNPADWKCDKTGMTIGKGEGMTESLWLNLSDGFIGGGRRNYDGSGGNNTALEHFEEMKAQGKIYPLGVKLGTITADGDGAIGDVFSYAEDDMKTDANLKEHLAHWGIDAAALRKTEKTMAEMELDLNQKFEWGRVLEAGKELEEAYGPGLTGIINMGNTCYMNSILQLIFSVQPFIDAYGSSDELVLTSTNPATDLRCQLNKVALGLLSGKHSGPYPQPGEPDEIGIRPKLLKMLVADGHPEFKTGRQQDAIEYLYHLLTRIQRVEKAAGSGKHLEGCFEYWTEERLEDLQSHKVKYSVNQQDLRKVLSLKIPMHLATNQAAWEEYSKKCDDMKAQGLKCEDDPVIRVVEFEDLIKATMEDDVISDWGAAGMGKRTRFATFPPYLLVHVMREVFDPTTLQAIKLEVNVPVPDNIDLSGYRGAGLQQGEVQMDDAEASAPAPPPPPCDAAVVSQLVEMGFPETACQKAVIKTDNNGADAAMNWLMQHMEDPDFAAPYVPEGGPASSSGAAIDEGAVEMLMSMGFARPQCVKALQETNGDQERAVEWIFSHPDDDGSPDEAPTSVSPSDGPGKYELVGFVTHLGKNTSSGHYVSHIKKDGRWIFFNDEKVRVSQEPPRECGYLYLYKQMEQN